MTFTIAHRGLAVKGARENTLEAVDHALNFTNVVEVDVRCTHDAELVCSHDASLTRTHGADVRIGQIDQAKLRELAPDIPRLEDMVALVSERGGALMLDFKVSRPKAIEALESIIKRSSMSWNDGRQLRRGEPIEAGTVTFQSADAQLLQAFRSRSGAGCLELIRGDSTARELILGAPFITTYAQGITIPDHLATRGALRMLRGLRIGTYVYTINVQARFEVLARSGASAVYTDHVDRIG